MRPDFVRPLHYMHMICSMKGRPAPSAHPALVHPLAFSFKAPPVHFGGKLSSTKAFERFRSSLSS